MISLVAFALLPFSVFALSWLMRYTDGPFEIFLRLRQLVGIRYLDVYNAQYDLEGVREEIPRGNQLASLLSCFWCLSTYVSLILSTYIWVVFDVDWRLLFLVWLASVGASGFLHELVSG